MLVIPEKKRIIHVISPGRLITTTIRAILAFQGVKQITNPDKKLGVHRSARQNLFLQAEAIRYRHQQIILAIKRFLPRGSRE
jgi:hypothetical protein